MSEEKNVQDVLIRRMQIADVDAVTGIEQATFARPWSRESFMQEMEEFLNRKD